MNGESARRVAPERAATPAEITAAIEGLSDVELVRLSQYASARVRLLGRKAGTENGDDLLQSAITDLLEDKRRWDKAKVSFMGFLFGAMKSISSNWAKAYLADEDPIRESELKQEDVDGKRSRNPLDRLASSAPTAERRLSQRRTLQQIETIFKDDQEAQMVLTAWQERYDPSGVRELWNLTQNEYNTIVRRIRRTLEAAGITADRDSGGAYVQ
jgi:hypothetical protein